MSRPACARIDLTALKHNLQVARQAAPNSAVIAVIKADAYGHGVLPCASALNDADAFAVAGIDEAIVLRDSGFDKRILLLGGLFHSDELAAVARLGLDLVLHEHWQIEALLHWQGEPVDVWLKVDTGMHRLGIRPDQAAAYVADLNAAVCTGKVRLMTHLACADDRARLETPAQLAVFQSLLEHMNIETSIANSAGVLGWPDAHGQWLRPGIMLYGASPFVDGDAAAEGLKPVMHLESEIIAVRDLPAGEAVGYGATWQSGQAVRMGVAAMGYADGYPRHLPSGTPVLVGGQRVPLIGRVSMDLVTLDLTDVPESGVGSIVRFWGEGLPADEIARAAGTIAYELFTGVAARVRRQYI